MRILVTVLLVVTSLASYAKEPVSSFHRLLIFNDHNELLLVKIKDKPIWVTTGWYQDNQLSIMQGLKQLAGDFGFEITQPKLVGIFNLQDEDGKVVSLRNFYTTKVKSGSLKLPAFIEKAEWLSVDEAVKRSSFPHINWLTKQVLDHPYTVWGGSIKSYKEGGSFKAELVEPFYPMTKKMLKLD